MIVVSPDHLSTSESGTSASFNVRLNSAPTAAVEISLVNPDSGEWSLAASTIILDAGNWQTGASVQVSGVDDAEFDGTQSGILQLLQASSADPAFNGIDPADVALSNVDDELAAIIVEPTTVTTTEGGTASAFVVRLNRVPSSSVTIPIGPVDASEWQILETEVQLDAGNWETGYSVMVTPVDDDLVDGDQNAILELGIAQSPDAQFAGIDADNVLLLNIDNDAARIVVAPSTGLIVDENGATANFLVALTTAPTGDVHIALSSGDSTEFALTESEIVFTPLDWNGHTVVVSGVDDNEVDGNIVGAIVLAPAVSTDARYDGINPTDVTATNLDNETIQVDVDPVGSVETSESGTR